MRWLSIFAAAVLLAGCAFTPQGDAIRSAIKDRGAQAHDEGIVNSVWYLCHGASVGSIRRWLGTSDELPDAYKVLCKPPDVEVPP